MEEKNLSQKLSEDIISLILEENLKPGDRLPNESVLSSRLGAGRSSVREAIRLLVSRNIVTVKQGSGTYLASSPGMTEDPLGFTFIENKQKLVHDLLEVRFLLEPSIAAMAAAHADDADIQKITSLCAQTEALLKTGTGPYKKRHGISHSHCYEQQKCGGAPPDSSDQPLHSSVCGIYGKPPADGNHRNSLGHYQCHCRTRSCPCPGCHVSSPCIQSEADSQSGKVECKKEVVAVLDNLK